MAHRVVVTGMGVIGPIGLDTASTWESLVAGCSGVDHVSLFDASSFDTTFAAEVKGFDPLDYIERREARRMDRFCHFAVAAARQAVEAADLTIDGDNRDGVGVIVGCGIGGITTLSEQLQVLVEKGPRRVSPLLVPMMIADMASGWVSMQLGARGPNYCTTSACASGADAIGDSFEAIRRGDTRAMIAGGTEAPITPIGLAAFGAARALSTRNDDPKGASRPFDSGRDGFVMAEGAAVLVLEELEFARRRGAPILAEVLSYGATGDAYHLTQPAEGGEGAVRAMRMALRKAGLQPEDIDHINAHGTATPLGDKCETQAIKTVFGERSYSIPITSTKSITGHLLGAAGAIEAVASVLTIREGVIPPTINLTDPDPECDLDYVPNEARRMEVRTVLSNSLGFGGHNSTLIFRRYDEG